MEKKQETKKNKSLVKKAKKIRSVIMMTLLCVLMMSAATYAWFTLSNTSKVSNMTMTVGDVSGLQVADDENGTEPQPDAWKGATTAVTFKGTLLPATTTDGINIKQPKYNEDGAVSELETSEPAKLDKTSAESDQGYYVEYTFWIRATGADGQTTTVKLDEGKDTNNGVYAENSSATGTYSLSKAKGTNGILPSAAVRVSLIKDNTAKVYEPNSNFSTASTIYAKDERSDQAAKVSDVKQNITGEFSPADSNVLTLTNNVATKITLKLWLEGTDPQCGNEITAKDIITQLQFSTVDNSSGSGAGGTP